jgi:hypothetical protein
MNGTWYHLLSEMSQAPHNLTHIRNLKKLISELSVEWWLPKFGDSRAEGEMEKS